MTSSSAPDLSTDEGRLVYLADLIDAKYPGARDPGVRLIARRSEDMMDETFGLSLKNRWILTLSGKIYLPNLRAYSDPNLYKKMPVDGLLINYPDEPIAPTLIKLTHHRNAFVRESAALALQGRQRTPDVTEALLELLNDRSVTVRLSAILALGPTSYSWLPHNSPYWDADLSTPVKLFDEKTHTVHYTDSVVRFTPDPQIFSKLRRFMYSTSIGERRAVAYSLGQIDDQSAIPDLVGLLNDPDRAVRRYSARSLDRLQGIPYIVSHDDLLLKVSDAAGLTRYARMSLRNGNHDAQAVLQRLAALKRRKMK